MMTIDDYRRESETTVDKMQGSREVVLSNGVKVCIEFSYNHFEYGLESWNTNVEFVDYSTECDLDDELIQEVDDYFCQIVDEYEN